MQMNMAQLLVKRMAQVQLSLRINTAHLESRLIPAHRVLDIQGKS